mmetsp:Transcript_21515/g.24372  ORF Transcript_21515/g.24372 Transcript_21515/m.24372 type:complete len:173 (-) Transcript_21515:407-925(-)
MKVYFNDFTNDEMFSDSYNPEECFGGIGFKVKSKYIMEGVGDIDIGCGNEFGGAGGDEGADDQAAKVNNVVSGFKYNETSMGKDDLKTYFKGMAQSLKKRVTEAGKVEDIKVWQKSFQEMCAYLLKNYKEISFFTGESYETDKGIVFGVYEDDSDPGETFFYFADSLREEKF